MSVSKVAVKCIFSGREDFTVGKYYLVEDTRRCGFNWIIGDKGDFVVLDKVDSFTASDTEGSILVSFEEEVV